jgi:apoptotic chromatin condensation inducer in the nucleus
MLQTLNQLNVIIDWWAAESGKIPERQILSQTGSDDPKDIFHPTWRSFGSSEFKRKWRFSKGADWWVLIFYWSFNYQVCMLNQFTKYCELIAFLCFGLALPPSQKPATTSMRVERFVQPFTVRAGQELLSKSGSVCSFWLDHIDTNCFVTVCVFVFHNFRLLSSLALLVCHPVDQAYSILLIYLSLQ